MQSIRSRSRGLRLIGKILANTLVGFFFFVLCVIATLAIYFSNLPGHSLRVIAAGVFPLATVAAFLIFPRRGLTALCFLGAIGIIAVWWGMIPASNDRDWKPEVAVLAKASFNGDLVTINNIRNFDYKTRNNFTIRYYDKTFDLTKLESADLIVSYWDQNEAIAHTFFTFGFTGGEYLAISIEIRGRKGQDYSGLKGLFKQYEIIYVVGDERDLVRLRTNYRGEDLYLYPTTMTPQEARAFFVNYLRRINELAEEPDFYHTLGRNCTTSIITHIDAIPGKKVAFHRKLLLNGYSDELAYEQGRIRSDLPFEQTKRAHYVSKLAQKYNDDPEFSSKIRAGIAKNRKTLGR